MGKRERRTYLDAIGLQNWLSNTRRCCHQGKQDGGKLNSMQDVQRARMGNMVSSPSCFPNTSSLCNIDVWLALIGMHRNLYSPYVHLCNSVFRDQTEVINPRWQRNRWG